MHAVLCRILELGSGSGIVGMVLAFASMPYPPSCLILTDGEDTSVQLMQQNISHAHNINIMSKNTHWIHATTLKWGDIRQDGFEHECRVRFPQVFPQLDDDESSSSSSNTPIEFDCILAGDVLYKQELPFIFFQTVHSYLSKKGGYLLLCHVPRATVTQELVIRVAQEWGFHVESMDFSNIPIPPSCPFEDVQRACIYKMTLV